MYGQGRESCLGNAANAMPVSLPKVLIEENVLSDAEVRELQAC